MTIMHPENVPKDEFMCHMNAKNNFYSLNNQAWAESNLEIHIQMLGLSNVPMNVRHLFITSSQA